MSFLVDYIRKHMLSVFPITCDVNFDHSVKVVSTSNLAISTVRVLFSLYN